MAAVNVSSARSGAGEGTTFTCVQRGSVVGHGRLACPMHSHAQGSATVQRQQQLHDGQVRIELDSECGFASERVWP